MPTKYSYVSKQNGLSKSLYNPEINVIGLSFKSNNNLYHIDVFAMT